MGNSAEGRTEGRKALEGVGTDGDRNMLGGRGIIKPFVETVVRRQNWLSKTCRLVSWEPQRRDWGL